MRIGVVAVLVCMVSGVAAADPEADFARELQEGITLFQAGNLVEARAHLRKARLIDRKASAPHRYLAKVSQLEKEWDQCIDEAHEALVVDPSTDKVEIRELYEACRVARGRTPVPPDLGDQAVIFISSNVPAIIKVRGQPFGDTTKKQYVVPPGRISLEFESTGYVTERLDIETLPGLATDVLVTLYQGRNTAPIEFEKKFGTVRLAKRPTLLIVDGVGANVDRENKLPLSPGVHEVEIREPGKETWRRRIAITAGEQLPLQPKYIDSGPRENRRTMSLALGGGGAVMLAVGVGFFYRSRAAKDEAREILAGEIKRPIGDTTEPLRTRADFEDARSRTERNGLISNVAYTAGLALLGAGIYFFATSRAPSDDDVPDLEITPVTGGAVVGRTLRW